MLLHRIAAIPRLARNTLTSLLDCRAGLGLTAHIALRSDTAEVTLVKLVWRRRHVEIEGHVRAGILEIAFDARAPVAEAHAGLQVRLPRPEESAGLSLTLRSDAGLKTRKIAAPGRAFEAWARLVALPGAASEVWAARAEIVHFLRSGDASTAAALRRRFGLTPAEDTACVVPDTLFGPAIPPPAQAATILIPVFNAADDTRNLFARLPLTLGPKHRVIVIDDGSDDPRIATILEDFLNRCPSARLVRHPENLGFVAAVNSGTQAADPGDHIVILNTDTLPPEDWIDRLLAPIAEDQNVASVTPFSNAAEILSIPIVGIDDAPDAVKTEAIDEVARRLSPRQITLPTGIGFCMAMNRVFLDRVGGFDPAFGRGYGEEVDWCRKATRLGGKHVVQTRLFVGHRGGASFGTIGKSALIKVASTMIADRYPTYDTEVQNWIRAAPHAPQRLALALGWLGAVSREPVPVFLGHALGGGAETALRSEIAAHLQHAPGAVVLRVGGTRSWRVELHGRTFTLSGDVAGAGLVHDLLAPLPRRRIIYSCGVGAADPGGVPRMLTDLSAAADRTELRVHDFFPISPSWNLLDKHGKYRGIPKLNTKDSAHALSPASGRAGLSHQAWRDLWQTAIASTDKITCFAPSGRDLMVEAYPAAAAKCEIRAHALPALPERLPPGGQTLGILGGINRAKGGDVLARLGRVLSRRMVVIGELDGQFRLPRPHIVHGRYDRSRIGNLARDYDIGLWLIPSICPETFSFATHEALATGLPVLSFNLGAQADALSSAVNGHVLDFPPEDSAALLKAIEAHWLSV